MSSKIARAFLLFLVLVPASGLACPNAAVMLARTGAHETFDRLVFDAPAGMTHVLERPQKGEIVISFSCPATLKTTTWKLERAGKFEVIRGRDAVEPLAVQFSLAPNANVKTFMSGNSFVFDITGPVFKQEANASPPSSVLAQKEPSVVLPALAHEQKKEEEPLAAISEPSLETKEAERAADSSTLHQQKIQKEEHVLSSEEAKRLRDLAQQTPPMVAASFDPGVPVGVAVYERGGYVTVLFDRKISLASLQGELAQGDGIETLETAKNTVLRFQIPSGVSVRVMKRATAWEVFLVSSDTPAGLSTEFVAQPDFALGARLLVSAAEPAPPFLFEDPVVGDTLIVVPLMTAGAFTLPRRMADFSVVPAAQGLVIKPWNEKVVARAVANGVEITAQGGLKLSSARDTGRFDGGAGITKIFDFARWLGVPGEEFIQTRQKLTKTIVDVADKDKTLARLDLARFFFAHDMAREALALLPRIQKELPEIENQPDFLALRGACRILSGDLDGGGKDIQSETLQNHAEMVLWLAIRDAKKRDWATAVDGFEKAAVFVDDYPASLRKRIRFLMVETALAAEKYPLAETGLALLDKEKGDGKTSYASRYLRGVLLASTGQTEKAGVLWREAAKGTDRLYKIRAEIALIDLGVADKSLTPQQAADRLEGLRFAWRGDDLEFDILRRLGRFYFDAGDIKQGLSVLSQAVRLFPMDEQTPALKAAMVAAFRDVLLAQGDKAPSPLEALSLYTTFGSVIPTGAAHNDVRLALAEKLVRIDLLDQASILLGDVIRNSGSVEEKTKTVTRLAAVRLLDHKAQEALDILNNNDISGTSVPAAARNERDLLRARALSELERVEEALAAVPSDAGQAGKLLIADIALRARRWDMAADVLIALVGPAPKQGEKLSSEQVDWLVNAAVALAQTGNWQRLEDLSAAYGQAVTGAKGDVFRIITQPEEDFKIKDLASAQARLTDVDLFRSFLNAYREAR